MVGSPPRSRERPVALGAVVGHGKVEVSDTYEPVENDDYAAFSASFAHGAGVIQVSRVAAGHPNGLELEVFGDKGAATWAQERPAEFQLMLNEGSATGHQRLPPRDHRSRPPVRRRRSADGRPRCRSRSERRFRLPGPRVPGGGRRPRPRQHSLPRCASFSEGVHNMEVLAAVAESAAHRGAAVTVPAQRSTQAPPPRRSRHEVRPLQRDPARPFPARGPEGHRRVWV